jgi:hypothetical protein
MLSITCDNVSNNDTMVDQLEGLVSNFAGATNRTRCFVHIINLIAKTIIRQFDIPEAKEEQLVDAAMAELCALATDMDMEDLLTWANRGYSSDEENDEDDDTDGWMDERGALSASDLKELEKDVWPIRKVLVKVRCQRVCQSVTVADVTPRQLRKMAYAMKNSSTLILPKWFSILEEYDDLEPCMMPRDVSTRWNSTYDMLVFALKYRVALDFITREREMKLRQYEMDDEEWDIAQQLCDVLKAGFHFIYSVKVNTYLAYRFSRTPHFFSRATVHRTSQPSSPPWIASTKSSPPVPSTPNTRSQFKLLWPWERGRLIVTTARLTSPKFIGSR